MLVKVNRQIPLRIGPSLTLSTHRILPSKLATIGARTSNSVEVSQIFSRIDSKRCAPSQEKMCTQGHSNPCPDDAICEGVPILVKSIVGYPCESSPARQTRTLVDNLRQRVEQQRATSSPFTGLYCPPFLQGESVMPHPLYIAPGSLAI